MFRPLAVRFLSGLKAKFCPVLLPFAGKALTDTSQNNKPRHIGGVFYWQVAAGRRRGF